MQLMFNPIHKSAEGNVQLMFNPIDNSTEGDEQLMFNPIHNSPEGDLQLLFNHILNHHEIHKQLMSNHLPNNPEGDMKLMSNNLPNNTKGGGKSLHYVPKQLQGSLPTIFFSTPEPIRDSNSHPIICETGIHILRRLSIFSGSDFSILTNTYITLASFHTQRSPSSQL